ncbi:MAG: response regulator [Chitinophagaceae bacterium]
MNHPTRIFSPDIDCYKGSSIFIITFSYCLMKILIAEDDPISLLLLQKQLASETFELCVASDGHEAFNKLIAFQPDLLVTDLMMPRTSGLELIGQVRANYKEKLPILVLSAMDDESTVMEALSIGADDFIIKPAEKQELLRKIKRLCKLK